MGKWWAKNGLNSKRYRHISQYDERDVGIKDDMIGSLRLGMSKAHSAVATSHGNLYQDAFVVRESFDMNLLNKHWTN